MTEIKQLLADFTRYAHGQSLHTASTEMLDWMLLPFKWFDNSAGQQQAFETYRNHPKVNQLAKLVSIIGDLSEGYCDRSGELFMQTVSNGQNGQYFTPDPICDMLSTMQMGEAIEDRRTVSDHKEAVTQEDATDIIQLCEQFLTTIYVTPAIAKERRELRGK